MQTQTQERELLDLERRFWDAMKTKDARRTEQMTDDGCIIVGAQGVSAIDGKTMGKLTTEGKWQLEQFTIDEPILESIEMPRETVFITNIVKCRPPQNRKPLPDEMAACLPYLRRQIELLKPGVIIAMGGTAAEGMLGVKKGLGELRNKVHTYNGIPLVVTYHPAALLRNPNWKKPTWDDVRIARQLLDR